MRRVLLNALDYKSPRKKSNASKMFPNGRPLIMPREHRYRAPVPKWTSVRPGGTLLLCRGCKTFQSRLIWYYGVEGPFCPPCKAKVQRAGVDKAFLWRTFRPKLSVGV